MSLEQHAFIARENVPSVTEWQTAITQLGFDLQLDSGLQPFEDSGFVPCTLKSKETGFEIYYESADELGNTYPHIREQIESRNFAISFRWGGDMAECACVLIASAALAKSFDAIVYYPEDDLFYTVDALISDAGEALAEIDNPPSSDTETSRTDRPSTGKRWWEFWK